MTSYKGSMMEREDLLNEVERLSSLAKATTEYNRRLFAKVQQLEEENSKALTRVLDMIAYRMEHVWEYPPEEIGDLVSWDWVGELGEYEKAMKENKQLKEKMQELEEIVQLMKETGRWSLFCNDPKHKRSLELYNKHFKEAR